MPHLRRRFLGLCIMPILLTCLDDGLTLARQPSEYWAGNYAAAREGNRWFYRLMSHHPATFIAWETASLLTFTAMILLLPQTPALIVSIAFTLGYTVGASTWLLYGGIPYGHELFCAMCLLTAVGMGVGIRWGWRAAPRDDAPLGVSWPAAARWTAIAALIAVAAYMHLWPRG